MTKAEANAVGTLIVLAIPVGIVAIIINAISEAWKSPNGRTAILTFLGVSALGLVSWVAMKVNEARATEAAAEEHRQFLAQEMSKVEINDSREAYHIEGNDYRRGNAKENLYRKTMQLVLLEIFGNRCAKCNRNDNGLDLDHFFLSKNEGGNFIMRHRDGYLVNNAVPLCQSCNRSKSDESYKEFYSADEILTLFQKNMAMTKLLNERQPLDQNGNVPKKKRLRELQEA